MSRQRRLIVALLALIACVGALSLHYQSRAAAESLPERLTDKAFWQLVDDMSEPNGYFRSDNFLSNELAFQRVIPELQSTLPAGGVYVGVGPEQNFTYLAALHPKIAFIVDIRRGNLHEQLLYKAFMELSSDRADFLSKLFARPRPEGLSADRHGRSAVRGLPHGEAERRPLQAEPRGGEESPRRAPRIRAVARRPERSGVCLRRLLQGRTGSQLRVPQRPVRQRPIRRRILSDLCGSDDGDRRQRRQAQLPGDRRDLPRRERGSRRTI